MTPMTAEPLQSGAHIAERICCSRMESPLSKRSSVCASDVRMATFCLTTMSTIVREYGVEPSEVGRFFDLKRDMERESVPSAPSSSR